MSSIATELELCGIEMKTAYPQAPMGEDPPRATA
jgi:hypothetical protein